MKLKKYPYRQYRISYSILKEWKQISDSRNYKFIPELTYYGLLVSLQATLEVCNYLVTNCGFKYLLTARLNKDALEVSYI